jgi:hypothetical protein
MTIGGDQAGGACKLCLLDERLGLNLPGIEFENEATDDVGHGDPSQHEESEKSSVSGFHLKT